MLKLIEKELPQFAYDFLKELQQEIDRLPENERAAKAKSLWENRTNNAAFAEVERVLRAMCVGKAKCNYCEHNEAADVEHIAPKSLFPELTFVWTNYILACKQCNTGHKLDKMFVFSPAGSADWVLAEATADGSLPESKDLAYIHPRFDDPMAMMQLHLWEDDDYGDFLYYPTQPRGTRAHAKVLCTQEILSLGDERSLYYDRQNAFLTFRAHLGQYVQVAEATTFQRLRKVTRGIPVLDETLPIDMQRQRILSGIAKSIQEAMHPTVWREMYRQRDRLPSALRADFDAASSLIAATI
jgi:5-methylcytosine-specific restriction endonuclease McrA